VDDRFAQAFRRNYARVAGLAWQVLRDRAAAEDVAQESFLRLADAAVLERPDREVDAWLTRVALNRAINTLRGRRRLADREDRAGRSDPPAADDDPAAEVVAGEDIDRVRGALATLPDRQRAVLVLRHGGYHYAEIAEAVGVAPGSVGTLLARAERAFRRAFTPDSPEAGHPTTSDTTAAQEQTR